MHDKEIILKVENLCQYFPMGNAELKAVDDISFDIKKGEVLGLVGESGCGKTTAGRTIIRLYDATSGNVYLKNERIVAGTRSYKHEIKCAKREAAVAIAKAKKNPEYEQVRASQKSALAEFIDAKKLQIKGARYDHRNCQKNYSRKRIEDVKKRYEIQIEAIQEKLQAVPADRLAKAREIRNKYTTRFVCYTILKVISFGKTSEKLERLEHSYCEELQHACKEEREFYDIKKQYKNNLRIARKDKFITKIQMIFQDPVSSLNPRMTVRDLIAEGLIIKGMRDKDEINRMVFEVMDLVGLMPEHANRYQHEFSGGQRQRIGIARAIIMQPELLIADEPVSALDVSIQAQVITLLNELRDKIGLTILFIAHNLSVVKYFSDRIAVMYYGKIMELASKEELFARPMHRYTRALFSAVPYPDPLYEQQRKRIIYNPLADHDYTIHKPSLREVSPEHFVYCNEPELEGLKQEFNL